MSKNFIVENHELDKYQMKILNCTSNMLVIAGAGAGKTLTILAKIKYLIENNICKPENILVISFTNASVDDIKKKLPYDIDVFTFHKLAINILAKINYSYSVCDSSLLEYITKESIITCDRISKKAILKFLKLNIPYNAFLKSNNFKSFCNLVITFINLYKTNNLTMHDIKKIKYSKIEKIILLIIFKIYNSYVQEKNSTNSLDFDDLILCATKVVKNISLSYKYIIIDEFQDTSVIRLNLIKEIYKHTKPNIIVVGDDCQSIYRFSGCNLDIFLNFTTLFENVKQIKLINTYRNSLELINISSAFIQKNPLQIKKELHSSKRTDKPVILTPYTNKTLKLKQLINYLINFTDDIMILSRNNKDIYDYIDQDLTLENNNIFYKNHKIKYYTIHKSKGLEAKYVIVLNCNNELLGFPNKIENNKIITKLLPSNEIKYAEERRLFYVALTRCEERAYLMYDKSNPSIFIKEMKKIIRHQLHDINYF